MDSNFKTRCEMLRLLYKYEWEGGIEGYCSYGLCDLFCEIMGEENWKYIKKLNNNQSIGRKKSVELHNLFIERIGDLTDLDSQVKSGHLDINKYNYIFYT